MAPWSLGPQRTQYSINSLFGSRFYVIALHESLVFIDTTFPVSSTRSSL